MVWRPSRGRNCQRNAGKGWLTQPSWGRNQSSLLELCSELDLVTVINGSGTSWKRAGDGEGTQSKAGNTAVERDTVLAPRGQGTPRAPCCKEGIGKWHPESREAANEELHGARQSAAVGMV